MKQFFKSFYHRNKFYLFLLLVCFVGGLVIENHSQLSNPSPSTLTAKNNTLDTFIPKGYILFPIEVKNFQALDSILGRYGVVDIYTSPQERKQSAKLIAKKVKILRAPLNPSQFAILCPENQTHIFVNHPGPYFISVQNPKISGTQFGILKKNKTSRFRVLEWKDDGDGS